MDIRRQPERVDPKQVEQFVTLYTSHQQRLYRYAMTLLPNSVEAQDVLQEASLVLWQKFTQYQPGSNFFAWACRIVRHKA